MITFVNAYKTLDGRLFEKQHEAVAHDSILSYQFKKNSLKELVEQQRKLKRILAEAHNESSPDLQWKKQDKTRKINRLTAEIKSLTR